MDNLHLKTAAELAELVNSKQVSATDIAKYFLARAHELNPKINALNSITEELALEQAKAVDQAIADGEKLALAGVPIAIKDNICVRNTKTTCSSKILENFTAPYESTVTSKLWQAGAICIGKANLDEFAMGSSTEYSAFGAALNPWDTDKVPGGSSGGSAAAVAARLAPLALGSDTGGSIRLPASFCGIVGMKPSYGMVSRYGLVAFASSLDQIGPFALNVADAELLLSVISGHDAKDSTSLDAETQQQALSPSATRSDLAGLKVGMIKELALTAENSDPAVRQTLEESLDTLKQAGAIIQEVSMPLTAQYALDTYYVIAPAEASSNLARYDGVRYGVRDTESKDLLSMYKSSRSQGFGEEVTRRIMIGTYALSAGYYDAYYKKALQVRRLISEEYQKVFADVDILLSPTSGITAFPLGSKSADPLALWLCDVQTIPVNLAGLPSLSLNAGFDENNMPIGLQLTAPALADAELLRIASCFESQLQSRNQTITSKLPAVI